MFSSDLERVVHNVIAVESRQRRRCELSIKGRPNWSMAEG